MLIAKHEELRKEIVAFQYIKPFNQRIKKIASILRQDKLKVYILDTFDRTKRTFKRFLTQIKAYH